MIGLGIFAGSWAIATIHYMTAPVKRYNRRRSSGRRRVYGFLEQEDEYKLTETITKVSTTHKTQSLQIYPSYTFDNHYLSAIYILEEKHFNLRSILASLGN